MKNEHGTGLKFGLAATAMLCASASSGQTAISQFRELLNGNRASGEPAAATTLSVAEAQSVVGGGVVELKFAVELGEPPIATARDTRCEQVSPTNPAELVKSLFASRKDAIVDIVRSRFRKKDTEKEQNSLAAVAREEMKRQVWLPLAVERHIGEQMLSERRAQIVPEDDPMGADVYPKVRAVFDELVGSSQEVQPFELRVFIYSDDSVEANAEALPGGIVLVNMPLAQEGPELIYAYLAHELGHVTKRHHTMALQAKLIDSVHGIEALRELAELPAEQLLDRVLEVVDLTAALFTRYYTAQELEADGCGAKYLAAASTVDGAQSINLFLEDLEEADEEGAAVADEESKLVKQQHPSYAERRKTLNDSFTYWKSEAP